MRILFLALDVDICGRTGDSTHVRELASSFSRLGNSVALIGFTPEDTQDLVPALAKGMGVPIFIPKERGNLAILRFCRRLVRKFKPDVIYERRFSPKISGTLSKITGVPSMVEINGIIEEEKELLEGEEKSVSLLDRIKWRVRKYFFRSANGIVAVSEGLARTLIDEYGVPAPNVHVVHNGANTDLFRPLDRKECIEKLGLDPNLRYICFSGNLAPWQGVEYLISAVTKLTGEFGDLRVLIVGDGVQREDLETLAGELGVEDIVQFCGFRPYNEVPLFLGAAEVCVAPFRGIERNIKHGISPIKLYEYMSCARPFVTTSVWNLNEGIGENEVCVLVEPDRPDELAGAVADLMRNREKVKEMGERGRVIAEREYSWNAVASRIVGILQEVFSG
ncbi:MAG: glycosyltransferase family 4 protein [Thermoplasmata archaeon]|nr:glycosyltransferase family 4 protein [Thermoplasmata archaeon]